MSLTQWAENGWLRRHQTSRDEIDNLLKIVDRDVQDAREGGISYDWQFGIAYNAALKMNCDELSTWRINGHGVHIQDGSGADSSAGVRAWYNVA